MRRRWIVGLGLFGMVLTALGALGGGARADEVDDAAGLPYTQAVPALEVLLERPAVSAAERERLHRLLGNIHIQAHQANSALPHLEAVLRLAPDDLQARIRYAATLLQIANRNIAAGSMGRQVNPFLRDAVDTLAKTSPRPRAGFAENQRARLVRILVEARYLLQEHDEALAVLAAADIASLPTDRQAPLHDLEGRIRYARKEWEGAARAFLAAGHPIGAAAAWDAARKPEQSMPLYAAAIRSAPHDAVVLGRALAAVRRHKSHAALLAAIKGVAVPDGEQGVALLFAQAELLEGVGRISDALPLLRQAAERRPADGKALVALGRLLGVMAMSGDAVDEDLLDRCADAYAEAIARTPDSETAAEGLSWLASRDYRRLWTAWREPRLRARCLRVQRALAAAVPDDAWAWGNLGNTLRILGETTEALRAYAKAREANPYDPGIRSDEGLALAAAGRTDAALASYVASLDLDPGHLAGRQNAARALYLQGDDKAAAEHLGAATRTARAIGRGPMTYRFLVDRVWRARRRPDVR